eukprot:821572_1
MVYVCDRWRSKSGLGDLSTTAHTASKYATHIRTYVHTVIRAFVSTKCSHIRTYVHAVIRAFVTPQANMQPTSAPTSTPSSEPSSAPSAPTSAPTSTPSSEPSSAPSAPTYIPSNAPTDVPSMAPTRHPTADNIYTFWIDIELDLRNLTFLDVSTIALDPLDFVETFQTSVSESLVSIGSRLQYQSFESVFERINEYEVNVKDNYFDESLTSQDLIRQSQTEDPYMVQLIGSIDFNSHTIGSNILITLLQHDFTHHVETKLDVYFKHDGVQCNVSNKHTLQISDLEGEKDMFLNQFELGVIFAFAASVVVFILIVSALIYYYFTCYKRDTQSIFLTNPMVILIGIGKYEWTEDADFQGILNNLDDGIEKDIENMVKLFHDELHYDVYPSEYVTAIHDEDPIKQTWTEKELVEFLEDKATRLEKYQDERPINCCSCCHDKTSKGYDGLVVVVSGHGISRSICTSDYKKISKEAIHRIFSASHPKLRRVPRLFLFDCCSGNNELEQRESSSDHSDEKHTLLEKGKVMTTTSMPDEKEFGKQVSVDDVSNKQLWVDGDNNPDYRLAMIQAANYGFQSKLLTNTGSYMIHSFYEKTMDVLAQNKRTFIYETFEQIQE